MPQLQFDQTKMKSLGTVPFGKIESGVICKWGRIFVVASRGDQGYPFPVMTDGTILDTCYGEDMLYPGEQVTLIDGDTLGVTLRRAGQPPAPTP